ncbi:MAG: tRNA pseudouridine(55) synthase TruB [Atribacterota bacterium]
MGRKPPYDEMGFGAEISGGILNVYKPVGFTSRQVVERVGAVLGSKAGHAGTLDPFARGVLVVCWGKATRFSSLFQSLSKVYRAWIRFGISTDTYDVHGRITEWSQGELQMEQLVQVLEEYQGTIVQRVPAFSASKYKGKSLHKYARKGLTVPELRKTVQIYSLTLVRCQEGRFGEAEILVECSSGTYVRSLSFELGKRLGLGAYLFALRRESVGKFNFEGSIDVFDGCMTRSVLWEKSFSIDEGLYWIPSITVNEETARHFRNGNMVRGVPVEEGNWFKVYRDGQFLGLGKKTGPWQLQPKIVLPE